MYVGGGGHLCPLDHEDIVIPGNLIIFHLIIVSKDDTIRVESDLGFQSPPIFRDFPLPPPFFGFFSVIFILHLLMGLFRCIMLHKP